MTRYRLAPAQRLAGTVRVPGDKSISHRAVMLAAIAEGESVVTGFLSGEDCLCTMKAFRAMGVEIDFEPAATAADGGTLRVRGVGLHSLRAPDGPLDMGNSGTAMRLLTGLLAGQRFASTLVGDASLSGRPMRRVIGPLGEMGARIESAEGGRAPLRIAGVGDGASGLRAIAYRSPVASAQVKSSVLLAGLYAGGRTEVFEPEPSRDHTERMLRSFGVAVDASPGHAAVQGGQRLTAGRVQVPADVSSAAFFLVGAAITPGSELVLTDVGVNPTRTGIVTILQRMGAAIEVGPVRHFGGEPVSDLVVRGGTLRGIAIDRELVANAIDEFPALFVAAACAEGDTLVTGAEELRVKESDRIASMVDGLIALGVDAEARPDGALIRGFGPKGSFGGGVIDSHGDHRVAMSFSMASLRARAPIEVLDCDNVATSFPGFAELASAAGLRLEVLTD